MGRSRKAGKRKNVVPQNNGSKTTSVIVKNNSNQIVVNTTTIGDLSKHKENVINKVQSAIKLVESLDRPESEAKCTVYPIDHVWTIENTKIANEMLRSCVLARGNNLKITK